ncbi:MAG: S8 family peptidase [Acidobacteriota bacterium]|nr:S8 family serine peptidase [Blastocatellia bacterium]MDW8238474.1 S8 family peptidase [Acidobacteriota bacterium]
MIRRLIVTVLATHLVILNASVVSSFEGPDPLLKSEAAPGQILVRYREAAPPQVIHSIAQRHELKTIRHFAGVKRGLRLQQVPAGKTVAATIEALRRDPNVEYAEPNYIYRVSVAEPEDTYFSFLWGLHNRGQSGGIAGVDISALKAWDITTGSSDVVVGVIDTGIDYFHPDLAANMWINVGERPDNGLDDDGNGYIDDVHGWNAQMDSGDPLDDNNHGTHVAGTIGAVGNNRLGVTGVNWQVRLMALKFLSAQGVGYVSDAIECIEYAIAMRRRGVNIRVLNASWGGPNASAALREAIEAAGRAGMLVVTAAGNNYDGAGLRGTDNDVQPIFPASYDLANTISVAAVDRRGQLAAFSNYGKSSVDLAAPGVSIASTVTLDRYGFFSGTSMAAPHVAGVAALALAIKPNLTVAAMKTTLVQGVVPLSSLQGKTRTGGMVNAFNTLQLVEQLNEPASEFQLSLDARPVTLRAGESVDVDLGVRSVAGFVGAVTLSTSFEPRVSNVSHRWSSNPVLLAPNDQVTIRLTLTAPIDVVPGSYRLTVEGVSGDVSRTVSLPVMIEPVFPDPGSG